MKIVEQAIRGRRTSKKKMKMMKKMNNLRSLVHNEASSGEEVFNK